MEIEKQKKQVIAEFEVIYVPFPAQISVLQYPLRTEEQQKEFEKFLSVCNCQYKELQKKLYINYIANEQFTNINQEKNEQEQDFLIQEKQKQPLITYESKLIPNKINYFLSHLDKENKKIYLFAVDSFLQMRPHIKQNYNSAQQKKGGVENLSKDYQRDQEKEKYQIEHLPEKYVEQRQKNYKSYQSILESEVFQNMDFQNIQSINEQISQFQEKRQQSLNNLFTKYIPHQFINLQPSTKEEYIEYLENRGNKEQGNKKQ